MPPKCGSEPFHRDLAVGRNDDADRLAVDQRHQGFEHARRFLIQAFRRLKADAVGVRVIVVSMHGEGNGSLLQHLGRAGAFDIGCERERAPSLPLNDLKRH